MRFKPTILMIFILIFLSIYLIFIELPGERQKIEEKEREKKLYMIDEEDITGFSIQYIEQEIRFEKLDENYWEIKRPIVIKADNEMIDGLISLLNNLEIKRVVEEDPEDLEVFGLKIPNLIVSLRLKDNSVRILLGDQSPSLLNIYVKREDQKRVVLTDISIKNYLEGKDDFNEWRDKKI